MHSLQATTTRSRDALPHPSATILTSCSARPAPIRSTCSPPPSTSSPSSPSPPHLQVALHMAAGRHYRHGHLTAGQTPIPLRHCCMHLSEESGHASAATDTLGQARKEPGEAAGRSGTSRLHTAFTLSNITRQAGSKRLNEGSFYCFTTAPYHSNWQLALLANLGQPRAAFVLTHTNFHVCPHLPCTLVQTFPVTPCRIPHTNGPSSHTYRQRTL